MNPVDKLTLETIVNKYELLKSFGYFDHVVKTGLGFKGTKNPNGDTFTFEFSFPEDEKTLAFVTTLRQFTLDSQPHSFSKILRLIEDSDLSSDWKLAAQSIRESYYEFMREFPPAVNDLWGPRPTHEKIFKVVVYGDVVKSNNDKYREKFKKWTKDDIRLFVLKQEFTKVLLNVYSFIADLAETSSKELETTRDS